MADIVANGLKFNTMKIGSGAQKVICLHGLGIDDISSYYFTLANPIAQQCTVFLFDLRGHGKSDKPLSGYRLDDFVADLAGIHEQVFAGEQVYLLGFSFGSLLAMAYALRYPDRVAGLILMDGLVPVHGWQGRLLGIYKLEGAERTELMSFLYKYWHGANSERKLWRRKTKENFLANDTTLIRDIENSVTFNENDLRGLCTPTLALYGESSDILEAGHVMARLLPNCELQILVNCSHLLLFEGGEALKQAISNWLRRQSALIDMKPIDETQTVAV